MDRIFKYVKADQFFPKYCPKIKSYMHKLRGVNWRGNPTEFTPEELKMIKAGLQKMMEQFLKAKP
jgi:hypothetical protein